MEEENTASQDSKEYETEHDAEPSYFFHQHSPWVSQPPPVCHDHYITYVVIMEMEKLERRFHSSTSACDSSTCNTTNVPKAQLEVGAKKEAGLDDGMEEPEKKRMLKEKVGEELVAGKQAGENENVIDETKYVENGSPDLVPSYCSDVEAKCLLDLLNEEGWLTGEVMNEALYHIPDRALKFPNLFEQDCCILDCYLCQFVQSARGIDGTIVA
ncbi:hypothetical protein Fot_34401 [Forsythia ovata]|uniref:Uncharacterized protein n=1 Tax=Forsythia ovata TaxID=205694 RepID=A0ABD1SIK0_9LAMI